LLLIEKIEPGFFPEDCSNIGSIRHAQAADQFLGSFMRVRSRTFVGFLHF
jgi:hypothetical protein